MLSSIPKGTSQKCVVAVFLPLFTIHVNSSDVTDASSDDNLTNVETEEHKKRKCNYVVGL